MQRRAMACLSLVLAAIYPVGAFHGLEAQELEPCLEWLLVDTKDVQGLHKPIGSLQTVSCFPIVGVPIAEAEAEKLVPASPVCPS